MSNKKIICEN